MSEVEELEQRIVRLSPPELAELRDWILKLDDERWDARIAADLKAGKLNALIDKARQEFAEGKAQEL